MASLITYGSEPPHHSQQAKLGQEITGQYMPWTFLYVNNRFWLGKLQVFIGETDGPGRLYANVNVHVIKPVLLDLAHRGALSRSIYPMSQAADWPALRVQKFMPPEPNDATKHEVL